MRFFIFKVLAIAAAAFVLCLPFFPSRFRFSLSSAGYSGKDRWRNICFVLETILTGSILLCFAAYIKKFFDWLLGTIVFEWLSDLIPDRFQYTVNVITIFLVNIGICLLFLIIKKFLRNFLDKRVFKLTAACKSKKKSDKKAKKKRKNTKTTNINENNIKDTSEKRLNKLRRESILVFGKKKTTEDKTGVLVSDYVDEHEDTKTTVPKYDEDEEDSLSLWQLIKLAWRRFIGLFYSEDDDYEYVTTGTYKWANELRTFITFVSIAYLLVCVLIQIPVYFNFSKLSFFYELAMWMINNTYMYPMLSIVLLFEILWFICGEHKKPEEAENPFVSFVDSIKEEDTIDLDDAKTAIMEKYGEKFRIKNFETEVVGGRGAYTLEDKKQFIQNIAKAIRANKGDVNSDFMQSLEYMFDGKHVLFDSSVYSALGEYLVHYLFVVLSFGRRVLFVCKDKNECDNVRGYLESGFKQITKTSKILWRISTFEKMHEGETPDVLLLVPEQFLEQSLFVDGRDFFNELVDVFVLDVDKIITSNNYYCLIMAKKLEKGTTSESLKILEAESAVAVEKKVQYRFLSGGHVQALENSIRQFFNLEDAPLETFHSFGLASNVEVFIWHTGISSTLYVDNGANQVSLEVQIAKDAAEFGVTDINLISETEVYSSQRTEIQGVTLNSCDLSDRPLGYVVVADDYFNLPNSIYNYSRFSGRKATVLHVVSKPYLLRDYFTARAEDYVSHFELIGKTMSEHADATRASIIILLCDAVNGIERSAFIKRAAELLGDKVNACSCEEAELNNCVRLCYEAAFGAQVDCEPKYTLEYEQDSELRYKTFVYIKDSEKLFEKLLESTKTIKLEYINTKREEYIPVFKDEITQHFIPGQILVRDHHAYTIKEMDVSAGVLVLDDTGPSVNVPMDYIQTRIYSVLNATKLSSFGHDYRTKNSVVTHINFEVYNADVQVDTTGYFSVEKAVQTVDLVKPNFAKYVNLSGNEALLEKIKRNINTKMLVVELNVANEVSVKEAYTLSVVIHEFMKTIFPHQYRCVSVCPLFDHDVEEELFGQDTAIRDLYPRINGEFTKNAEDKNGDGSTGIIKFAVIEDIHNGNGIVDSLIDGNGIMVTNLLHVAADFLSWLLSSEGQECSYLNFGYDTIPEVFSIEKLEAVIRQFRYDVERSELVRFYDANACFFCHKTIEKNQGTVLEDGRIICSKCIDSTVNTFESLNDCFAVVMNAIRQATNVAQTLPKDICVDFVSTAELKERYKEHEGRLPIAYCNHSKKCMYVEYGLPRVSVCGIIARLVTELWQDENVVNDGSDLYAGHLDFVEIQTLSLLQFLQESEALEKVYANSPGLEKLKEALSEYGSQDSFAYFLGESGKKDIGTEVVPDEIDVSIVAERDPENLPRFYFNQLDENDKAVYDQIYQGIMNHAETSGPLTREMSVDRCSELLSMVLYDNPDIFWCANPAGTISYGADDGLAKSVIFKYCMTSSELKRRKKQIEKAIKPFLKGISPSMSDYEVALRTHENMVNLLDYDSLGLDEQEKDPDSFKKPDNLRSIYGVFVEEKAVCAGYAKAYQYILNRLGIECTYVRGITKSGGSHAWNLIKLEGDYYYVDVTHDDSSNTDTQKNGSSSVSYDYFCITTEELLRTRSIANAEMYPECTAVRCNYFVRSKLLFAEYDAERINRVIKSWVNSGKSSISIKASNEAVLALVKKRLIDERRIFDMLESCGGKKQTVWHCVNTELNIITFSIDV